jgi:3'-phosphoadenosine 5'-phosphosulfate sulfotransferase (PAPS reductase)/FAD synthetase
MTLPMFPVLPQDHPLTCRAHLDLFPDEVADLDAMDREARVRELVTLAHELVTYAEQTLGGGKQIVARVALFSGGNDSTVLTHLMRPVLTHAAHANTTIGIEATRQFVRDTCAAWDLPLLERHAPVTYAELVTEQGFPGPGHHYKMYQRLKERALREVRRELVTDRNQRVVFLAGRRRHESARRANIPEMEREGSVIWVSPLVLWTALDMNTYRDMHDVPRNEVSDLIHMSGECLCGAFATEGELDEIGLWFPDTAAAIRDLETQVAAAGHPEPRCRWGWGATSPERPSQVGQLCSSCDARQAVLFDNNQGENV